MSSYQKNPWQNYIDGEGRRAEPVIRDKGFPVWSIVGYYIACKKDVQRVLADYEGELTGQELDAALAYYEADPKAIDRKLKQLSS
jgi:uncharacterized protein (DUF433 family)